MTPQRAAKVAAEEKMMLAKTQTEDDLRDMESRRTALEAQIAALGADARRHIQKMDKRSARAVMLRRRRLLAQLTQVDEMMANLEAALDSFLSCETNSALLAAYKNSSQAITHWARAGPTCTPEDADSIRQEFDEQVQIAGEIAQIAAAPLTAWTTDASDLSIEDMLTELDELEPTLARPHAATTPNATAAATTATIKAPQTVINMAQAEEDTQELLLNAG